MSSNTIKEVRAWVTPFLVMLVGYLCKNKLEEIEAAVKLIPGVETQLSVHAADIDNIKRDVTEFRNEFVQHVDLSAKSEEEITLEKLKRSSK